MSARTTALLLTAWLISPAQAQSDGYARAPQLLVHGNYCGLGSRAPLPPVDALDAACARHDACTPVGGLPSRGCNVRLVREADRISRDPFQPDDVRTAAGFIAFGASVLPYNPAPPAVYVGVPVWPDPDASRRVRAGYAY
ncbi:hypothetical protein [Methylobacterium sp. ID0610]|uniref:hypothetical protein n=1 Tax=Methylobacterium carpenticola TaxID=3344827 RepID=UPI0036974820